MPEGFDNQEAERVALRPYQKDFVTRLAGATSPARFLLSAPPGSGKTVALSVAVQSMRSTRGNLRCLVVGPSALTAMWCEQLWRFALLNSTLMTPQTYRRLQAETEEGVNVWSTVSCAVASLDFLKSEDRIDEVLATKWDLVILDEAHRSTDETQRGDLAQKIWDSESVSVAVGAAGFPNQPTWMAEDPRTTKIVWRLSDILGHAPQPERRIHTVCYAPSKSEQQLAAQLAEMTQQMPKDPASVLTANLLGRRLRSSKYALEQTLRRLLTIDTFGDSDLNDWSGDDLDENVGLTDVANSVKIDREAGERILAHLEDEPSDSKWECCFQLLRERGIGSSCTGVIFTDFAETAEYLEYLAKSRGVNAFLFTSAVTAAQREQTLYQSRLEPSLLIASGAIEGADIRFTNQILHYDVPWNPRSFERRIGRVERVGTKFNIFHHYVITERGESSDVIARLMTKVRLIEEEWQ